MPSKSLFEEETLIATPDEKSLKNTPRYRDWLKNRPEVGKPYILSIEEQHTLLGTLPTPLQPIVLLILNTGCREREACQLQWAWEVPRDQGKALAFQIPFYSSAERLVILNDEAQAIIERQRGLHPTHVFTDEGCLITRINPFAWKRGAQLLGIPELRVYDLRCTFEHRLKTAGVCEPDRELFLGRFGSVGDLNQRLTHYVAVANQVCQDRRVTC